MLLNALITGRSNFCSTQRLSGIPDSISTIRPALARIVVAGIHDDHACWHADKQPFWQCRNITLRDGDYDQIHTSRSILRLDRDSTSFRHQARKSPGVSGIGHVNLVSQRSQPTGEGAAYLTCAYDADFHDLSYGAISLRDQHRRASALGRASRLRIHRG